MAEQAQADATNAADQDAADWGAAMAEQAEADAAASGNGNGNGEVTSAASGFQDFGAGASSGERVHDIDFIMDIPVLLTVELGRAKIPIKNLLQLAQGSVVELDGLAGEPMDVLV
ncbi:MAG: FliM/FliN family flagellar motor switch protein, partial [Burkholderiaceae bacterium]|nr:FliM/FliN family flagellar motor switch protein [Burkholderiaceae bacterium]